MNMVADLMYSIRIAEDEAYNLVTAVLQKSYEDCSSDMKSSMDRDVKGITYNNMYKWFSSIKDKLYEIKSGLQQLERMLSTRENIDMIRSLSDKMENCISSRMNALMDDLIKMSVSEEELKKYLENFNKEQVV